MQLRCPQSQGNRFWKTDEATIRKISQLHAESVAKDAPGCSTFVCDNAKLRQFIAGNLEETFAQQYRQAIETVRTGNAPGAEVKGMTLREEKPETPKTVRYIRTVLPVFLIIAGALAVIYLGSRRANRES